MSFRVRVGEIPPDQKDEVGKNIIRIDSKLMEELDSEPGDPVRIKGSEQTVAKILGPYKVDQGLSVARMDKYSRLNAGTSLGEHVEIQPAEVREAEGIVISPKNEDTAIQISDKNTFRKNLSGRYVMQWDEFPLGDSGGKPTLNEPFGNDFTSMLSSLMVAETIPSGPVKITKNTEIEIMEKVPESYLDEEEGENHIPEDRKLFLDSEPETDKKEKLSDKEQLEKISKAEWMVGYYENEQKRIWSTPEYFYSEKVENKQEE